MQFKSFEESLKDYLNFINTNHREPTQKEMLWVGTQRRNFKKGKLSQQRIDAILKVNPSFFNDIHVTKTWEEHYRDYVKFINTNQREPTQKEMFWVADQKRFFSKGKLSQQRIDAILKVNPNFFEIKDIMLEWEENLHKYIEFKIKHQREPLQKEMFWVRTQRGLFKKGKLSQQRIDAILKVNPNFFDKKIKENTFRKKERQINWERNLRNYELFLLNNFREPQSREMLWTTQQRRNFKKGKLSQQRIDAILKVNPSFFDDKPKIRIKKIDTNEI